MHMEVDPNAHVSLAFQECQSHVRLTPSDPFSLSIPFDYVPRSRPPMSGPEPTASVAAALKQSPKNGRFS